MPLTPGFKLQSSTYTVIAHPGWHCHRGSCMAVSSITGPKQAGTHYHATHLSNEQRLDVCELAGASSTIITKEMVMQFSSSSSGKFAGHALSPAASSDMQQQTDTSGSFSFQQGQPQQALRHSHSSVAASASLSPADEHLFATPTDLVCPITLTLFQDPVCNALGQVYERAALQRHLLQAAVSGQQPTDPVSNAVLPSLDLVPVWPMRSRAAEYRDSTIRACVQAAVAPDCTDPVRYLRRAAELVLSTESAGTSRLSSSSSGSHTPTAAAALSSSPAGTRTASISSTPGPAAESPASADGTPTTAAAKPAAVSPVAPPSAAADGTSGVTSTGVPGLTLEFAQYLAAHRGSQYDALVLKYFGNELLRAECPDAASNVFYRLLLEAEDKVQQAEYLQLCLDCWTCSSDSSSSGGADSTASSAAETACSQQLGGKGVGVRAPAAAHPASAVIISKLADFVQRQRCLNPRAIVQMLESTHHGSAMAMQLCQVLLSRAAGSAAAAGPAGNAEAALGLPGGLGGVLEVLLELVELGHGQLLGQVEQLTQQVQQLQALSAQQEGAAPAAVAGAAGEGQGSEPGVGAGQHSAAASGGAAGVVARVHNKRVRGHRWRGGKGVEVLVGRVARVAAAATLSVACLAGGNAPLLRVARVGPLLYLLRSGL